MSKREKVATSFNGRDISCTDKRVAIHLAVATSISKTWVATSLSSRDNISKEKRLRHHSEVATSDAKTRRSRPHLGVMTSNTQS